MGLLSVRNLEVFFPLPDGTVHALDNIELDLKERERIALIGETGSGKTVLGRAIMRLLPPGAHVHGEILYNDRNILDLASEEIRQIRGREIAIILQNPAASMNPVITVGNQVKEAVQVRWSLAGRPAYEQALALLGKVGLPLRAAVGFPHQLSGGMRQRALVALGLASHPRLLIADEPTKGLDSPLRAQIVRLFKDILDDGMALFLITHDLPAARELADTVAVMYAGQIVECGRADDIFCRPRHPYTKGLLASHPSRGLRTIPGIAPSLANLPTGCRFHPRCDVARDICLLKSPPLAPIHRGHKVRCFQCSR